jgi:hypothetical protein
MCGADMAFILLRTVLPKAFRVMKAERQRGREAGGEKNKFSLFV